MNKFGEEEQPSFKVHYSQIKPFYEIPEYLKEHLQLEIAQGEEVCKLPVVGLLDDSSSDSSESETSIAVTERRYRHKRREKRKKESM